MGRLIFRNWIIWIKLFFPNLYVLIGIIPFLIFIGGIPEYLNGYYFYNSKIEGFNNSAEPMGKSYNTCYVVVYFRDKKGLLQKSIEYCNYFDFENDINKPIYVRIQNEA